jgi:aconitate hydratase
LIGFETFDITGIEGGITPRHGHRDCQRPIRADGSSQDQVKLLCRIDTLDEVDYYRNGGILHYVLRSLAA